MFRKVFEKLVNNALVDHLGKWLFSDFYYGFRSTRSAAEFLTVVSDRIARVFNRSRATQAVVLDISKDPRFLTGFWHADLLHKHKSCGVSGQIFGLISSFLTSGSEGLTRMSSYCWSSSRFHSWSNTFPTIL